MPVTAAAAADQDWQDCQSVSVDVAIAGCTSILSRTPQESEADRALALAYRGQAFGKKNDLDRALADFQEAERLNPSFSEPYNREGSILNDRGDHDQAIAKFDLAIQADPKNSRAYYNRGFAYRLKGDLDRAVADYNAALQIDPGFAEPHNGLGIVFAARGDHDGAIAEYDQVLKIDPKFALAYENRGISYQAKGELERAVADFEMALSLRPGSKDLIETIAQDKSLLARKGTPPVAEAAPAVAADMPPAAAAPATPAASGPRNRSETRVALVIGNGGYRNQPALANPASDAAAIAAALQADGFTKVTLVEDLDREQFIAALQTFAEEADNADWAVVYYAGHGIEIAGTNYLIPIDAKLANDRDVADEAVSLDRVELAAEGARKLRLIVLDACRNNPFLTAMKRSAAGRDIGRGLAIVRPSQGTIVAYSAQNGTIAADGEGSNSPFAAALAKRISEPGVEINKVFRLVRSDVLTATDNRQDPSFYGDLPPDDFFFVAAPPQ